MVENDQWPLQRLLDACIEANQAIHDGMVASGAHKARNVRSYHADCRTIRLDIGMRSGKSTAIARNATEDDVIVCGSQTHYDTVFRAMTELKADVVIVNQVLRVDKTYKRIWLDEPRRVFQYVTPGYLYELLSHDHDQLYILLGP